MGNVYVKLLALAEKKAAKAIAEETKIGEKTIDAIKDVKKVNNNTPKGKSCLGADEPVKVKIGERENPFLNKHDQWEIEELEVWDNIHESFHPKPTFFINKSTHPSFGKPSSSPTTLSTKVENAVGDARRTTTQTQPKQPLSKENSVQHTEPISKNSKEVKEMRVQEDGSNISKIEKPANETNNTQNKGGFEKVDEYINYIKKVSRYK